VILPHALRFSGPVEWARCSTSCSKNRNFATSKWGQSWLIRYWLQSYDEEGQKDVLKLAICQHIPGLLRPLAETRADINCIFEQYWFRTPLHRAASRGHSDMCRLLLTLRADSTARDSHGAAPIHLVASKGRQHIVELLLRHDPSGVRAVDFGGRTPYHMAALKGHLNVLRMLLAARGNPFGLTSDGRTPLDMARRVPHNHVIDLIEAYQKKQEEDLPAARQLLGALFHRTVNIHRA